MRIVGWMLFMTAAFSSLAGAAREIEPNDHWLQATLVDGSEPLEGELNDEVDVYKILLPEPGRVRVLLDGYPAGSNLTLEVLGFSRNEVVPLMSKKTRGEGSLELVFDASGRAGYLSVEVHPFERVCKDQWCLMRLTADGPYYLLQSSPMLPPDWKGQPILAPPGYRIRLEQPQQLRAKLEERASRAVFSGFPSLEDLPGGLSFHYLPGWEVRRFAQAQKIELTGPANPSSAEALVRVEVRSKSSYPGSSAEWQLNLAERDLLQRNGEVRKRGSMDILQESSPYLLGTFPQSGTGAETALLQVVLDRGEFYYWLSYLCPVSDYETYAAGFTTLLKTLAIRAPGETSPGAPGAPANAR